MSLSEAAIREKLREVVDPEMGINIVDLGLVYSIVVRKTAVTVDLTLTSPLCPVGPMIIEDVRAKITSLGAALVEVQLVWEPPWSVEKLSDEIKLQLGLL